MRGRAGGLLGLLLCLGALVAAPGVASAAVNVQVDIAAQTMTVAVDGVVRHKWSVSTARRGKMTPTGVFAPESMKVRHRSTLYHNAPMPHSIFFHGNFAIHGTNQVSRLGNPASAGCIRLHPTNAATLFALVKTHGPRNTRIAISR